MSKTSISLAGAGLVGISLLLAGISYSAMAAGMELSPMQEKVKKAMKLPARTEKDTKRDRNRAPMWAMEFWGLKDDMKVIEFAPGNGWYTKLLAPVLRDKGELHLVTAEGYMSYMKGLIEKAPYDKAKTSFIDLGWDREERRYTLNSDNFGVKNADMVVNIREYHNFNAEDKVKLNKATFDALKPGGTYVIVDHSRRHMAPETFELRRREDPVKVILEVQAAGFVLEKSSDMFYRPDDEMVHEVGRKTVTGNTDRFTLVFKKPK